MLEVAKWWFSISPSSFLNGLLTQKSFPYFPSLPPSPQLLLEHYRIYNLKKNPSTYCKHCNYSTLTLKLPHIWPVGVLQIGSCPKLITRILCVFWHNMFQNYLVFPYPRSGTNQKRASEWLNTNLLPLILNPSGCGGVWGVGGGPSWLVCKWMEDTLPIVWGFILRFRSDRRHLERPTPQSNRKYVKKASYNI